MVTTLALKIATIVFSVRIYLPWKYSRSPEFNLWQKIGLIFLMSFKYVFKSIKFPRQNFLFFKFGRVLVRNSGSLPTVQAWGSFPGELPMLHYLLEETERGLVPLLPYELFLHSTGISLFPYTHSRDWILEPDFGSFIWTLPLLASLCSGWFLFYQRHFLSDMFMGPGRQSWGRSEPSYSSHFVTKRTFFFKKHHNRGTFSQSGYNRKNSQEQFYPMLLLPFTFIKCNLLNILQWWHLLPPKFLFFLIKKKCLKEQKALGLLTKYFREVNDSHRLQSLSYN